MIHWNGKLVRETRRAAILTLFVMLLPVLLVMLGFSVDMAYMQLAQTEMRLASDNIARIAADNLSRFGNESQAIAAGKEVAEQFTVAGQPLRLNSSDFDFGRAESGPNGVFAFDTNGSPPNAVRINAIRNSANQHGTVPLFFRRLVGPADDAPQVSATASFVNLDICLVLDRSTGMKFAATSTESDMSTSYQRLSNAPPSSSRQTALRSAVQLFTKLLDSNTSEQQVSVVTFGSDLDEIVPGLCERLPAATLDLPLTTNIGAEYGTLNTVSNSDWDGNTEIASGILLGTQELTSCRSRRLADKVMIVLTDGYPMAGNAVSAAKAAAAQKIVVHAITFGPDGDQDQLRQVAAAGNGEHAHAADQMTLKALFKQFAAKATILIQ